MANGNGVLLGADFGDHVQVMWYTVLVMDDFGTGFLGIMVVRGRTARDGHYTVGRPSLVVRPQSTLYHNRCSHEDVV